MNNDFDFIAIGDTVVDTFIRLNQAEEVWNADHTAETLNLSFADKIPYEFAETLNAVGNSPNAAVSASRLGLQSAIVSNIGDDDLGTDCLESFHKDNVDTKFIKTNHEKPTNHHYVLWFHQDRTILIKHEEYEYELPEIGSPKFVYLSSLREGSWTMYEKIIDYLSHHLEVKLTFQPGVYDMKMGTEKLRDIYKRTELFFCNVGESRKILKNEETDIKKLLKGITDLGPKSAVITDGPDGAYVFDGKEYWFIKAYPDPRPAYERTGAGDAFASTFTSAIILGKTPDEALRWASVNATSVVQQVGAQKGLLSPDGINEYLKNAPSDWQAEKI